jgi:hypothetical protein
VLSIFPADEPPGQIALEDRVAAYESLRNLVIASAYPVFANQHRLVQPAASPRSWRTSPDRADRAAAEGS